MKINIVTLDDIRSEPVTQYLKWLEEEKVKAQNNKEEEKANFFWRELEAIKVNNLYIDTFEKIKNKQYRTAWNQLERCEIDCDFIIKNSEREFSTNKRLFFIQKQVSKFQELYPYCLFTSPGFVVGYYTCSICGHKVRPRSRCGHEKGKIYNGELCVHEGHDLEIKEISIVDKPVQKYSVMHDDSTLDFSVLEHLMSFLTHAFEPWDYNKTTMSFPREKFINVDGEQECPCKSGKLFKECCSSKSEITIPHIDFLFSKEISQDMQKIKFPYE